jgi:uncharacterized protein (TIGR00299 family) protein
VSRVLYLDLVGGASGDMLLAALVDLGAPLEPIREALSGLGLDRVRLETRLVHPAGLRARRVEVWVGERLGDAEPGEHGHADGHHHHDHAHDHHHHDHDHHGHAHDHDHHGHAHDHAHDHAPRAAVTHRPYRVVRALLESAALPDAARALALDAFHRLALAEGEAHGVDPEDVHFHEVGSDDAIADVVGVVLAREALGLDRIVVSPVPLGRGLTRGAHGPIPLPGPATLALLAGAPLVETALLGETVTPTGAALLAALADDWGPIPSMRLLRTGVGAGRKTWPDRPNVVRALLGERADRAALPVEDELVVEANLDDMTPEHVPALLDALLAAGAADVWTTPIQMKKGRSGLVISALARASVLDAISAALLTHSTTLGLRITPVRRLRAERRVASVETIYGAVRVKIGPRPQGPALVKPEHEDCAALAARAGVPVRVVAEAALRAAWAAQLDQARPERSEP